MVFFLLSRVAPHNYKTGSRVRVQTNRSGGLAPHFKKPFAYPPGSDPPVGSQSSESSDLSSLSI
jgi:hypothetical protein